MGQVIRMRKLSTLAILAAVVCLGCPRATPPPSIEDGLPAPGGTVVIGILIDLQSWNPYLSEDENTEQILDLLYPSLAIEQTDYRLHPPSFEPHLAESWEWSDDHLVLTFHLDRDATWSDGVPVTADDVVFSWKTQTSPEVAWPYVTSKDFIELVEAVDSKTVRFVFSELYPYQMMDANDGPIVPAHLWSEIPYRRWNDTDWRELVVSAGPFTKTEHTPQQEIVLERNPRYFKEGLPYLDRVVWRVIPSRTNLLTQLLSGHVDLTDTVPPNLADRVRGTAGLALIVFPDRGYSQIRWNLRRPIFSDPRTRTALSSAIDRDLLIDVVYNGFARTAFGPILSDMWAFNRSLEPVPFDVDRARSLLGEAGWSDSDGDGLLDRDGRPFEFELLANAESELRQDICLLVEENLERVGIRVVPRFVEWGTLGAAERRGDFDAIVGRWTEPTMIDLNDLWRSAAPGGATMNSIGYANPEVDRLPDVIDETTDLAAQKELFDRIQELITADQPYTFLVEHLRLVGLNSRLRGADINDATPYFNIDEWYVEVAPPQ
jgi:peptide/nickel transport system substrate-binding protein